MQDPAVILKQGATKIFFNIITMKIELLTDESTIDTWAIIYTTPDGGKYNGKLTITTKRLLFDAKSDVPVKAFLPETMLAKCKRDGYLEINKSDIKDMLVEKSLLAKKATLTLADGSKHTFNYGVLNIDKVVEAIKVELHDLV